MHRLDVDIRECVTSFRDLLSFDDPMADRLSFFWVEREGVLEEQRTEGAGRKGQCVSVSVYGRNIMGGVIELSTLSASSLVLVVQELQRLPHQRHPSTCIASKHCTPRT